VLCDKADCLRSCAAGPILRQHVIYEGLIEDLVVARHQFGGRRQRSS
jgi:(2Fe-2S) ferredoxin